MVYTTKFITWMPTDADVVDSRMHFSPYSHPFQSALFNSCNSEDQWSYSHIASLFKIGEWRTSSYYWTLKYSYAS